MDIKFGRNRTAALPFAVMQKFYMNFQSADEVVKDPEGSRYPNKDTALEEAYAAAKEMVVNMIMGDQIIGDQCIEITDEDGAVQGTVRLRDVIRFA